MGSNGLPAKERKELFVVTPSGQEARHRQRDWFLDQIGLVKVEGNAAAAKVWKEHEEKWVALSQRIAVLNVDPTFFPDSALNGGIGSIRDYNTVLQRARAKLGEKGELYRVLVSGDKKWRSIARELGISSQKAARKALSEEKVRKTRDRTREREEKVRKAEGKAFKFWHQLRMSSLEHGKELAFAYHTFGGALQNVRSLWEGSWTGRFLDGKPVGVGVYRQLNASEERDNNASSDRKRRKRLQLEAEEDKDGGYGVNGDEVAGGENGGGAFGAPGSLGALGELRDLDYSKEGVPETYADFQSLIRRARPGQRTNEFVLDEF